MSMMAIASKTKLHTPQLRRGAMLKQFRTNRNLNQADIATWCNANYGHLGINMTQRRISQIENGSDLKGSEVFVLSDCFGLEVEKLRCF